ncbi:hypothetical protein HK413_11710 [Mucilaginibacter sp. S1162]|uniref:Uncharacterized protein n=1 Tax=Mucilaginibacter humi TaxID=2732510 RepID=A0ABX1W7J4_9SPHI|nr:hypothetical protein [Mucilaginibacter humi]NNU34582.1 hypothetical protein [Mucilaginibacter humi]
MNAKSWYEEAYPINKINKPTLQTNSVGDEQQDISQKAKPDWQRPKHYKRFNNDVIEMPFDVSGKLEGTFKNATTGKFWGTFEHSRSSYLLLKNNGKYEAYIMTIIGDSAYLKNDLTKLARNNYNKRDTDFSGMVVYTTPKGKYINSWRYKNGSLVTTSANNSASTQQTNKLKTQNYTTGECTDWFYYERVNGVVVVWEYAFTSCTIIQSEGPTGGSSSTPNPQQCPGTNSIQRLIVNGNAPPGEEPIDEPDKIRGSRHQQQTPSNASYFILHRKILQTISRTIV